MSSHFQIQSLAAQNVEVQVVDGLAGIIAAVGDNAVAVMEAFRLGDLGDHFKNVGNHSAVFSGDCADTGNMRLGDHQHMGG